MLSATFTGVLSLWWLFRGPSGWKHSLTWLRARLASAGISVQIDRVVTLQAPGTKSGALQVGTASGADGSLDTVFAHAMKDLWEPGEGTRWMPVILTECLMLNKAGADPTPMAGLTPRIPGGAPLGIGAGGIFLATSLCDNPLAPGPDAVEYVFTHEIGHYLGLYHSDSEWGGHRRAGDGTDLMVTTPGAALPVEASFTSAQIAVIRAHPDVIFDP